MIRRVRLTDDTTYEIGQTVRVRECRSVPRRLWGRVGRIVSLHPGHGASAASAAVDLDGPMAILEVHELEAVANAAAPAAQPTIGAAPC